MYACPVRLSSRQPDSHSPSASPCSSSLGWHFAFFRVVRPLLPKIEQRMADGGLRGGEGEERVETYKWTVIAALQAMHGWCLQYCMIGWFDSVSSLTTWHPRGHANCCFTQTHPRKTFRLTRHCLVETVVAEHLPSAAGQASQGDDILPRSDFRQGKGNNVLDYSYHSCPSYHTNLPFLMCRRIHHHHSPRQILSLSTSLQETSVKRG